MNLLVCLTCCNLLQVVVQVCVVLRRALHKNTLPDLALPSSNCEKKQHCPLMLPESAIVLDGDCFGVGWPCGEGFWLGRRGERVTYHVGLTKMWGDWRIRRGEGACEPFGWGNIWRCPKIWEYSSGGFHTKHTVVNSRTGLGENRPMSLWRLSSWLLFNILSCIWALYGSVLQRTSRSERN